MKYPEVLFSRGLSAVRTSPLGVGFWTISRALPIAFALVKFSLARPVRLGRRLQTGSRFRLWAGQGASVQEIDGDFNTPPILNCLTGPLRRDPATRLAGGSPSKNLDQGTRLDYSLLSEGFFQQKNNNRSNRGTGSHGETNGRRGARDEPSDLGNLLATSAGPVAGWLSHEAVVPASRLDGLRRPVLGAIASASSVVEGGRIEPFGRP